jgi:uncharacterized membrane protein YraQ (UPF0718 family)
MLLLYVVTVLAFAVSFVIDRKKSVQGVSIAVKKFLKLFPAFVVMTVLVAIVLSIVSEETISEQLGREHLLRATISASLIGSIAFIPGFIVFPLCGMLKSQGVTYTVLSAFTTTLMMVGVLSFPVEKKYLGLRVTVIRNITAFFMALLVALFTGLFFGEIV